MKKIRAYNFIKQDPDGYLKNFKDWNTKVAEDIAIKENIYLNVDHWKVIFFIRTFYLKFHIIPSMRILLKTMKIELKNSKINSIYLFKLFPKGPVRQASKIAGIPKPSKCL